MEMRLCPGGQQKAPMSLQQAVHQSRVVPQHDVVARRGLDHRWMMSTFPIWREYEGPAALRNAVRSFSCTTPCIHSHSTTQDEQPGRGHRPPRTGPPACTTSACAKSCCSYPPIRLCPVPHLDRERAPSVCAPVGTCASGPFFPPHVPISAHFASSSCQHLVHMSAQIAS